MGVLLVLIILVVGVVVVNLSNAANSHSNTYATVTRVHYSGDDGYTDYFTPRINSTGQNAAKMKRVGKFRSGAIKWTDEFNTRCYTVASNNATFFKKYGTKQERFYNNESIIIAPKTSCNL